MAQRETQLVDDWRPNTPIALTKYFERERFAPWLVGSLALVAGFLLFQGLASVLAVVFVVASGVPPEELSQAMTASLSEYTQEALWANTIGQFVGLGLLTLVFAWFHTRQIPAFLRLRAVHPGAVGLSVLGWVFLFPFISAAGQWIDRLPWPEVLRTMQESMSAFVTNAIAADPTLVFSLFAVAVTPALCEELLFRGYAQRQFERSMGPKASIVLIGVIFGLYHLQPINFVPLSLLGIYMAYLTWRTGSLWPAIVVHFLNNAFALSMVAYATRTGTFSVEEVEQMPIPWYVIGLSLLLFAGVIWVLQQQAIRQLAAAKKEDHHF